MQGRIDTIVLRDGGTGDVGDGATMGYSWGVGVGSERTDGAPVVRPIADVREIRPPQRGDLHQLAIELAPMVDVWKRLLAQHVPDRTGRCIVCTKGGTGLPSRPWPCSIHAIAEMARRRHDEERTDRPAV
jgi:hypothetical protein